MNEYWHSKWKIKDIGWDQQQPNPLLVKYFNHLKLKPGARIFVPLCGKSIDMLWLAQQGYQIIGVDISLEACQLFFNEHNILYQKSKKEKFDILANEKITLLAGDFFDLDRTILGPIDAIYDRAALIALPIETRQQYANKIITLIAPNTKILLDTISYDQSEMQGPPFSVDEDEVQQLFGKHFRILQLYNKPIIDIASHLSAKGLKQAYDLVFILDPI